MNTITIIPDRFAEITELDEGGHGSLDEGVCAMEAVSYIVGEPWSDHPQCVCPVIAAFMRSWNDGLPNEKRTELLLPLIAKTIGTRGSADLANRRANMAADWFIRVHTPAWLRLAGLTQHAELLASMPEIIDFAKVPSLLPALQAARTDAAAAWDAARDAVGAAAWDAVGAAAWDAARAAAGGAAWDAARAAAGAAARDAVGGAAWAAAWAAAWDAVGAAAWDAAGEKLAPIVIELQASAVELVERMCALSEDDQEEAAKEAMAELRSEERRLGL